MSRSIPAQLLTALTQDAIEPYHAVEMQFDSGTIRLWTGYGERIIESNTYYGAGQLLAISGIEEVGDLSAKGISITLTGIDTTIVSLALQEPYQGRPCRVLFGETSVTQVVEVFAGLMDVMTHEKGPDTVTLSLSVESKLVALQRANTRRYTQQNHIARNPGDNFFSAVASLQDKEIQWGTGKA